MDAKAYIQAQFSRMRRLTDATLHELTDDQLNWTPPGTANPAGATLVHVLTAEDHFVQAVVQGKSTIWTSGGWEQQIGLSRPPGRGQGWDEVKATHFKAEPLLAYARAVRAATDAYLATLTAEELDRQVTFMAGEQPVGDVIAALVAHTLVHAGEIAAVKGMQGGKGLPF